MTTRRSCLKIAALALGAQRILAPAASPAPFTLPALPYKLDTLPAPIRTAVRNQGGGHYNHSLCWQTLAPASQSGKPGGELAVALTKTFGSQEKFEDGLKKAAVGRTAKLAIESTPNQDTPLPAGHYPVVGIDLKYQNRRPEYVTAILHVINWDLVSNRLRN